ncbi:MAG: Crp/Fnr family transcriptional regulator [Nitrincola sp.]|nr:Crp/Fnr family transcriptional regulator [Nitrincola sp.]
MTMCPSLSFVGEKASQVKNNRSVKCTDPCLIRKHALFCCLSEDRFDSLLNKAKLVDFPANSLIFSEGEPANKFYFILKGCVKTYRTTQEGDEHLIDIINAGHLIADSEIFDQNRNYHSFAETTRASQLLCFSSEIFRDLVHQDQNAAHNLLSYFSKVLKQKNYDLEVMINCPARERVLIYFRELAEEYLDTERNLPKKN